jgi:molybdopterin-binding protein
MKQEEKFAIILSKNRLAREVKRLCNGKVDAVIRFDFQEIEKITGVMNQPTAEEIFDADIEI